MFGHDGLAEGRGSHPSLFVPTLRFHEHPLNMSLPGRPSYASQVLSLPSIPHAMCCHLLRRPVQQIDVGLLFVCCVSRNAPAAQWRPRVCGVDEGF